MVHVVVRLGSTEVEAHISIAVLANTNLLSVFFGDPDLVNEPPTTCLQKNLPSLVALAGLVGELPKGRLPDEEGLASTLGSPQLGRCLLNSLS